MSLSSRTSCSMSIFQPVSLVWMLLYCLQSFAQQPSAPKPPFRTPPQAVDQEQVVSYWTTETGWKSELQLRNNQLSHDITVTPSLRLADGSETALAAVTIKPQEVIAVDLTSAIASATAPQLIGTFGSMALRYKSTDPQNLYAALMVYRVGHSIAFHIDGKGESPTLQIGSREGIWWLPKDSTNDYLILTNRGKDVLPLELSLYDSSGKLNKQNLSLGPRQTTRYSVRKLTQAASLSGSYGGLKVAANAHAGSLDSLHILFDETSAFSATLKMFDHDPNAKLEERDLDSAVWALRAPMLALSDPDPVLAFPLGTTLHPQLLIRNTTNRPLDTSLRFAWRGATSQGKTAGPVLHLIPYETRRVDIGALQGQNVIPKDANWTSVTLATNGMPDEIMAIAASYDDTLQYGAQTPFSDQLSFEWEGGMWEFDPHHNSLITAGNGGSKPVQAAVTLFYNKGTQRYDLEQNLQPDEQMWVDIGKLIRDQVPDKSGKTLPADITSGSYEFRDLSDSGIGSLFEGKVIYDTTYGHVTYGCANCCGYSSTQNQMWYDPLPVLDGSTAGQGVNSWQNCNADWEDVSIYFTNNWSTTNTTIATVDSAGTHTGVSPGFTTTNAFATLRIGSQALYCPRMKVNPSGPANVIRISQSPTILNISSGDTGKGVTVSVSPSSVASSVVFAQGGITNPNSSSQASFTYNKPSSFTGNDLWTISIGGINSPSGAQNSQACAYGLCSSQLSNVAVPPQILIQMIQAEAGGTNVTTMTAVAEVARNRFSSSIFDPPYSTYQNAIPNQFATTTTTNGIEPELDIAASVFTGNSAGAFCGSLSFWTPTSSQWSIVQTALGSGTTTFPSGTGAPTYDPSKWPTSSQQILFVPAVGSNSSGVPYFLFLAQRGTTQAAAVNASCN